MKKAADAVLTVSKSFLCIGFGIQIILGVIWMCFNMPHLQTYAGQGSSLFRGLVPVLERVYPAVYAAQLALALWAGYVLLRRLLPGVTQRLALFGALALCTFPFGLQCHMAISPYSLVCSLMLLFLGCLIGTLREEPKPLKELALALACWVGVSLLVPEYFLIGLLALVTFWILLCFRRKENRRLLASLVLVAAVAGLLLAVNALTAREQMIPDREQSAYSLCSRISWPTIMPDHERWPEELQSTVENEIWNVSLYAERMEAVFRPLVTGTYGEEQAAEYYSLIAKDSWNRHKNLIVRQIIGDFAAYTVTPVILPVQLAGRAYASFSGRNYELFLQQAPAFSKVYLTYCVRWFLLMIAGAVVVTLFRFVSLWKEHWREMVPAVLLLGASAAAAGLLYTFRGAGIMDYKCCVFVNLLWLVWAIALLAGGQRENE